MQLPIDSRLPEIVGHTERNTITLLQAEPGAGKTTRIPPALLRAGFSHVYVLEPRRLAARMAARRVAEELNEPLGKTVGYQVRFEKVGDASTALWFLTEGVFTNRLLSGPALPQRTAIVLDEFHERHLETDLALALLRRLTQTRADLRILILSATLPADLSSQLPGSPLLQVSGRTFPVEVRYTPASAGPLGAQVASAAATAFQATHAGHVLIFLPGSAEIRSAISACQPMADKTGARVLPLYGDLNAAEQDLAVAPSTARKFICATNVAESSITIEGVTAVVDSGLARLATHSTWTGFSRLQIARISQASAIQRAGRAGRTAPGLAIRLFPYEDFVRRPEATPPEVIRADWADTLLRLAAAGIRPGDLPWLNAPPPASLEAAADLLTRLHALDASGRITAFGERVARLSVHPRLGCLALKSADFGAAGEGVQLAAWLADDAARLDRRQGHRYSSDLEAILAADLSYKGRRTQSSLRDAARLKEPSSTDPYALEKAVLAAYPDRVAIRRGETLLLSNGASARLETSSLVTSAFLVALEVENRAEQGLPLVRIASAVQPDWLLDLFPERLEASDELCWNRTAERVEQVSLLRYDRLVLDESISMPTSAAASDLLVEKALEAGLGSFTDADAVNRLLARLRFAARYGAQDIAESELVVRALGRVAAGLTSFAELKQSAAAGLLPPLEAQVDMRQLEEIAPTHVRLPSSRRAPIEYIDGQAPAAASRLQDFFGMKQTPTVARGAVPLTVKLLAPNGRPVQITTDLLSFWKDLYPQVRRELSRRYPRHSWPETPG